MLKVSKKRLRSPIRLFGGKGRLVSRLLKYVPEHTYYLEAYGGGASLLFAKKPSKFEVYNDIDDDLVTFFRVIRDPEKFDKFLFKVSLTPYSRSEFYLCRDTLRDCTDDVERAYKFFILARMAFSGRIGNASWSHAVSCISRSVSKVVSGYLSTIEMLPEIHARLMRVQIECLPALECIEKYGSAWGYDDSFIYLDPPYVRSTRRWGGYRYEMSDDDHKQLVEYLIKNQNRNKFMLSGYDNEIYKTLEMKGWKKICFDVGCNAVGKTRSAGLIGSGAVNKSNQRRVECIWMNYDITHGE